MRHYEIRQLQKEKHDAEHNGSSADMHDFLAMQNVALIQIELTPKTELSQELKDLLKKVAEHNEANRIFLMD